MKDLVEGLGVPHTEIDLILVNGRSVDFDYRVASGDRISVYPMFEAFDISGLTYLRPEPLRELRFVADVHLGRLAVFMRLAGFDTTYRNDWDDASLVSWSVAERRVLLTRDRGILKRAAVTHGYLVRETLPRLQFREVMARFDLWGSAMPLTRCSVCNSLVGEVEKSVVDDRLQPGTRAHYDRFCQCRGCGRVYWRGAHYRALRRLLMESMPEAEE